MPQTINTHQMPDTQRPQHTRTHTQHRTHVLSHKCYISIADVLWRQRHTHARACTHVGERERDRWRLALMRARADARTHGPYILIDDIPPHPRKVSSSNRTFTHTHMCVVDCVHAFFYKTIKLISVCVFDPGELDLVKVFEYDLLTNTHTHNRHPAIDLAFNMGK